MTCIPRAARGATALAALVAAVFGVAWWARPAGLRAEPPAPAQPPAQPPVLATADLKKEDYRGLFVVLIHFSIQSKDLPVALRVLTQLRQKAAGMPIKVLGATMDEEDLPAVARWMTEHKVDFPVYRDPRLDPGDPRLSVSDRPASDQLLKIWLAGPDGALKKVQAGLLGSTPADKEERLRAMLFRFAGVRYLGVAEPLFGYRPPAPDFDAALVTGGRIRLADLRGLPALLVFVSASCEFCAQELPFLRESLGPELAGKAHICVISSRTRPGAGGPADPAPGAATAPYRVALDPDGQILDRYSDAFAALPDNFLIDAEGRIARHWVGFRPGLTGDLLRMGMRQLAGLSNPPLLPADGYSGVVRCAVCHPNEHWQWKLTRHAEALSSLRRVGQAGAIECVGCHVTGPGEEGGYDANDRPELANVQCEACHGPAARHPYNGQTRQRYEETCLRCHDRDHSIAFNYDERLRYVVHEGAPDLSKKGWEERERFLEEYRRRRGDIFAGLGARYLGAESCKECHAAEYADWSKDPHAQVSPERAPQAPVRRLVTGFERPGGYPEQRLVGVQCEACHGPGEQHVKDPRRKGAIIPLRAQCNRCIAEPICLRCHGPADDPKWDFEQALPRVGHPTAKAAAGERRK